MHDDAADRARLLESHAFPGEPAVGRFEDAAARGDRVARILFTGAGPHLHRVGWGDRQLTHRHALLVVEHRPERRTGVRRLPDSPSRGRHEKRARGARNAGDARHPAGHVRGPDVAPAESGEQRRIEYDALPAGARRWGRHTRRHGDVARRGTLGAGKLSHSRGVSGGWWRLWWWGRLWRWCRGILRQGSEQQKEHDGLKMEVT